MASRLRDIPAPQTEPGVPNLKTYLTLNSTSRFIPTRDKEVGLPELFSGHWGITRCNSLELQHVIDVSGCKL
ncbi:hypothetical protein MAN_03583, partial [Metarhizium hybridum]